MSCGTCENVSTTELRRKSEQQINKLSKLLRRTVSRFRKRIYEIMGKECSVATTRAHFGHADTERPPPSFLFEAAYYVSFETTARYAYLTIYFVSTSYLRKMGRHNSTGFEKPSGTYLHTL